MIRLCQSVVGAMLVTSALASPALASPTESIIHAFNVLRNGAQPQSALIADSSGALYGTTYIGGAHNDGTIFKLTPPEPGKTDWQREVIHSFDGTDGANPAVASLVADSTGALYGTTLNGNGLNDGKGTVYKLAPPAPGKTTWTETVLYQFKGATAGPADGSSPSGALVLVGDAVLYGTTRSGGPHNGGTVFELARVTGKATWRETVLYSFISNPTVSGTPSEGVVANADGTLYGTTAGFGGYKSTFGTIFKLTPPTAGQTTWTETQLYSFQGSSIGRAPNAPLTFGPGGALYGATESYVFKLTPPPTGQPDWTITSLYRVALSSGLILDANGALYGTSYGRKDGECRAGACGTVYKLTPPGNGSFWTQTVLHPFKGGTDGEEPAAGLIADSSGALYGTTAAGGDGFIPLDDAIPGTGTVFKLTPPLSGPGAWTETVLVRMATGADGAFPRGALITDASGALYGTTSEGGPEGCEDSGCGTVLKLTPPPTGKTAWDETLLYAFQGGNEGSYPTGSLTADATGSLYGLSESSEAVTSQVFKLTPPGPGKSGWTHSVIYTAPYVGSSVLSSPVAGADGSLYGTFSQGGPAKFGTIYKLTPPASGQSAWTGTDIYTFKGGKDGALPEGGMTLASGGLYGTTFKGGSAGGGTVFKLTAPTTGQSWTKTTLYSFVLNGGDAGHPQAPPIVDASGALYGTASAGGAFKLGAAFKLTPPTSGTGAWTETLIHSFAGPDGAQPQSALVAGAAGAFYGTTPYWSGSTISSRGTVFKLAPPSTPGGTWGESVVHNFLIPSGSTADGEYPEAALVVGKGGALYGTTSGGGPVSDGTVFKITP